MALPATAITEQHGRARGIEWRSEQEEEAAKSQYVDSATKAKLCLMALADIVYSQPADTGTGQNINTQLVYAVNHLKQNNGPMRLQDLAIITNIPVDTDKVLLEKFKAHDRVIHDTKTDLYSYRVRVTIAVILLFRAPGLISTPQHDFNVRNKISLLTEIQRQTRKGGGLSVRTLKESWKEAPQAIEELEKEGEVYVTRTLKDGQLRMVFWNEIKPKEEGDGMLVEQGACTRTRGAAMTDSAQSSWTFGAGWTCRTRSICSSSSRTRACRRSLARRSRPRDRRRRRRGRRTPRGSARYGSRTHI